MDKFIVKGPSKLKGEIAISGSKNAALPILASTILFEKEVVIKNEMIASKCGWTPFHNYKVKGFPIGTIVNGILVMSNGKILIKSKVQPLEF